MQKIKLLVMDADGTLTDGKINISPNGEIFKSFNVKDGYGIVNILPKLNITPVVMTGRKSNIVSIRCNELGINHCYQGVYNKKEKLLELLGNLNISNKEVAYIGDDLNDLEIMNICGVKGCPIDAVSEIKQICDYICKSSGGYGAVREFIDWIYGRSENNYATSN